MNVKIFHGTDLREALSKVKAELGSSAVIMSTRTVKRGNAAFGMFGRQTVEVTAALDDEEDERPVSRAETHGRRQRRQTPERKTEQWAEGRKSAASGAGNPPKEEKRADAFLDESRIAGVVEPLRLEISELREIIASSASARDVGRMELKKASMLADDIEEMKAMFGLMLEESEFHRGLRLERNFLVGYRRMIERGIEPSFALKLVKKVKEAAPAGTEPDIRNIVAQVIEEIKETMLIGDPIYPNAVGPRVAALVGPTGVGKTTTVAKIAANLMLEGKKVGLITIDTYRIAAVEQLKIYAGIMNLPIEVVVSPEELGGAIKRLSSRDVILIDTAGRSQRDAGRLDELASFLGGDGAVENYLVLSSASEQSAMDETVRNFGCVPLSGLIFTKLDESAKPGVVISQNYKTGLPVVYCTTGQRVPEDIEKASPEKLGTWIFKKEPWENSKVA